MRLIVGVLSRLRNLLRRAPEDDETAEELRFHLEMEAEKNEREGLSPEEAYRRARVRLGGVDAIREAVRDAGGTRPLEDLLRDFGYALRGARRNPGFAIAVIVSLAVPIGFNTALFTIVDSVLFRPLPLVRPAEIVDVYTSDPDDRYTTSSYPDYLDLRVAIVSHAMALRFWPDGTAVGRRFRLAEWDGVEYEVVGVSADYKVRFPTEEPASYLHLAASQRLRTGAVLLARTEGDAAALSADIRRELRRMEPDLFFFLQGDTLRETADVTMLPFRIGASVASVSGIVAMMLGAIGLYGVIAYLVAGRTREFAIRAALGARSGTLLRLVLATGAWVVAVGVAAGAGLALLVTRVAAQAASGIAPADPVVWGSVLLLLVAVCAAAFAGPARRMVRLDVQRALRVD